MPIKNYTTQVPASRSIDEIQQALIRNGATAFLFEYEQGTGRISTLKFRLPIVETVASFSLPVDWRSFQAVLKKQQVKRWDDEDYCYRVAWRVIRDWVMSQLALYETQMVQLPQIFLPFVNDAQGNTLYDKVLNSPLLLGNSHE